MEISFRVVLLNFFAMSAIFEFWAWFLLGTTHLWGPLERAALLGLKSNLAQALLLRSPSRCWRSKIFRPTVCATSLPAAVHTLRFSAAAIKPKQEHNAKQENTGETTTFPICININFAGHVCSYCVYSLISSFFSHATFVIKLWVKFNLRW